MLRAPRYSVAALFLIATIAQTALARAANKPPNWIADVRVRYADLDPRKDADARILLERFERAAIHACGGNPKLHRSYEIMPRRTVEIFQQCQRDAIARAVAKVDAPALSHVFAAQYRQPVSCTGIAQSDARPPAVNPSFR
jgi:UrcA family protein